MKRKVLFLLTVVLAVSQITYTNVEKNENSDIKNTNNVKIVPETTVKNPVQENKDVQTATQAVEVEKKEATVNNVEENVKVETTEIKTEEPAITEKKVETSATQKKTVTTKTKKTKKKTTVDDIFNKLETLEKMMDLSGY